jgi:prepilin-type N-terminal cleavage/methylation domain-containing protein
MRQRSGFTLVELSIVLVIIGLLIGGILTAQSMIDSAVSRKAIRDLHKLKIFVSNFDTTYRCLPGDCSNASAMGLGSSGNGNGLYDEPVEGSLYIWQHLQNSGMADFKLPSAGIHGDGPKNGINLPEWKWLESSRATGGSPGNRWTTALYLKQGDSICGYQGWNGCESFQPFMPDNLLAKNTIVLGQYAYDTIGWTYFIIGSGFYSERAQAIDVKIDDGQPRTGFIKGFYRSGYSWDTITGKSCGDGTNNPTQGYQRGYTCQLFIDLDAL